MVTGFDMKIIISRAYGLPEPALEEPGDDVRVNLLRVLRRVLSLMRKGGKA